MTPKSPNEIEEDREIEAEASDLFEASARNSITKRAVSKMTRAELEQAMHKQLEVATMFQREFRKQLATLLVTAFGFAAALFWQNAIVEFINAIVPQLSGWHGKLAAALIVTGIAITAVFMITRYIRPGEK